MDTLAQLSNITDGKKVLFHFGRNYRRHSVFEKKKQNQRQFQCEIYFFQDLVKSYIFNQSFNSGQITLFNESLILAQVERWRCV